MRLRLSVRSTSGKPDDLSFGDQLQLHKLRPSVTSRPTSGLRAATNDLIASEVLRLKMNKVAFGFVIFLCVGGPVGVIVYHMLGKRGRQLVNSVVLGEPVAHEE